VILSRKIAEFICSHDLVAKGDRLLVGVSGGPDSVALLHVLCELRDELRLELEVAHLQHGVRGQEAREDARFVARLAEKLDLRFHLKELDLPRMKAQAGKGNLEALGRAERHRFFADVARERKMDKVATAHTLDDQAETVVMWFLRGTGLKGLGGMSPLQPIVAGGDSITVIRPLLEISKAEILDYLKERRLDYRLDRTNQDSTLLRNWLRLELLPKIQQRLDAGVPARLAQQAEIFRDEDALLDGLARSSHATMMLKGGCLSRAALLNAPKGLQRRVLRLWIEQVRGHLRAVEFVHIEDMLRLIKQGPPQGRVSIPGGWELVREYETLKLEKRIRIKRPVCACYDYPLKLGKMLRIPEAGLEVQSESAAMPMELPADPMEAVFDLERLTAPLSVRNFRRGDRFQPLGMIGRKKIKDLFIEKRVPLSIRATWPLLTLGQEVLWIPGYGRGASACVSTKTTAVLHLKVQRSPG
jgi:tRNA(Ile)-lysidine synthase